MGQARYEKKIKEMGSLAVVARMILEGSTPDEIAASLGCSVAKANAEIRSCYIRTNTNSRPKFTAIFFQELLAKDF